MLAWGEAAAGTAGELMMYANSCEPAMHHLKA